jgi:hypothetical protein
MLWLPLPLLLLLLLLPPLLLLLLLPHHQVWLAKHLVAVANCWQHLVAVE